jgi:hypothetical protein
MMSRLKCSFTSKSVDCKQIKSQKGGKNAWHVVESVAVQNATPKKGAQRRSKRILLLSLL